MLQVRGWAFCRDLPDEHIQVEVFIGERLVGSALANLFRDDLQKSLVGKGDHAFIINFNEALPESDLTKLRVQAFHGLIGKRELPHLSVAFPGLPEVCSAPAIEYALNVLALHEPVFILGAARSGTSALAQSLLKTGYYEGFQEGHLLDLAGTLLGAIRTHYERNGEETSRDTLIAKVPIRVLDHGTKDQFRGIANLLFPSGRWIDKTPRREMIKTAPLLREIWPNAKIVFLKRRAIENISSRVTKFSSIAFSESCKDWADIMRDWRQVREKLGGAAIELDQLDMALRPQWVAKGLGGFLGLPSIICDRLGKLLESERPERTSARFGGVLDFASLDWDEERRSQFLELCGEELRAYGYGLGKDYFISIVDADI